MSRKPAALIEPQDPTAPAIIDGERVTVSVDRVLFEAADNEVGQVGPWKAGTKGLSRFCMRLRAISLSSPGFRRNQMLFSASKSPRAQQIMGNASLSRLKRRKGESFMTSIYPPVPAEGSDC